MSESPSTARTAGRALPVPAWLEGWPLVATVSVLAGGASLAALALEGFTAEGYGLGAQITLRLGFVCFIAAFVASSLPHVGRGPVFQWILRNRRYLGVGFAVAHLFHFFFVWALVDSGAIELEAGFLREPGLLVYLLLAAMVATSFDATAARLPRRAWLGLHRTGMYAAWFAFFAAFGGRVAAGDPFYLPFTVACVLAVGLRWWVSLAQRRHRRLRAAR